MDTWMAVLSDGSGWNAYEPALASEERSPWMALVGLAAETERRIVLACACLGRVAVAIESLGHNLTCGRSIITRTGMGMDASSSQVTVRWVRREEPGRWLWRATDGQTAWEVVTPPGEPLHRHLDV